ncbi:hypothetical protein C8R43DRAFT_1016204 [Mycena crocata]|nr:hypothetical protein C8R43DRAFT_1016204 [Mycena crocata]
MALVLASPSRSWVHAQAQPLFSSATWNVYPQTRPRSPTSSWKHKSQLRLCLPPRTTLPVGKFDPFADDIQPVASTSQLPLPTRGRPRTTSFSAGCNTPRCAVCSPSRASRSTRIPSSLSRSESPSGHALANAPSVAPSPSRSPQSSSTSRRIHGDASIKAVLPPVVLQARRHPTPESRSRFLARTLLNRINPVGRPRRFDLCLRDGYEDERGSRGYVPSPLSQCVCVA